MHQTAKRHSPDRSGATTTERETEREQTLIHTQRMGDCSSYIVAHGK